FDRLPAMLRPQRRPHHRQHVVGHQRRAETEQRRLRVSQRVDLAVQRLGQRLEDVLNLPAIMPPKRGACIGPLRGATPPPTEGRSCSSLTRGPVLWAWSTEEMSSSNVPISTLHGGLRHLPQRAEVAQVSLVVPCFGPGQLKRCFHLMFLYQPSTGGY